MRTQFNIIIIAYRTTSVTNTPVADAEILNFKVNNRTTAIF